MSEVLRPIRHISESIVFPGNRFHWQVKLSNRIKLAWNTHYLTQTTGDTQADKQKSSVNAISGSSTMNDWLTSISGCVHHADRPTVRSYSLTTTPKATVFVSLNYVWGFFVRIVCCLILSFYPQRCLSPKSPLCWVGRKTLLADTHMLTYNCPLHLKRAKIN